LRLRILPDPAELRGVALQVADHSLMIRGSGTNLAQEELRDIALEASSHSHILKAQELT
jgi:hypothetical protein